LFKRHPACLQTVNHESRGDFWGGRQFAQPLNIMLSHCTALHVVVSGEKQDAPLPIYRRDTRCCFPLRRIFYQGTDESPLSVSLDLSKQSQKSSINITDELISQLLIKDTLFEIH